MDCRRCSGELETYTLADSEASVCPNCGFVDTPVDHSDVEMVDPEPWSKAIERFYERYTTDSDQ
jgi:hypothetical protein